MSFLDKISDFITRPTEGQTDYEENEEVYEEEVEEPKYSAVSESTNTYTSAIKTEKKKSAIKSSSMDSGNTTFQSINVPVTTEVQVVITKPVVYADTKSIADHMIEHKTVVLNLESADPQHKRRILDFLAGVAYAQKGNIKCVANLTYLITPHNVGFIGEEIVDELENNGISL